MFQKTIVSKYLKTQNQEDLNAKWEVFKAHFQNPQIQENIRNSKEEQYQGEFLIDLFVNVLGYTKNPTPNFNLTTENKNVKDSKKADGAIIIKDSVVAIIELKGTNTTDLSKIEDQAFGYKNNQPDCKYVLTSNFEKLRFYIDNAIENIEFNLFELTRDQFDLLYLCLAFENVSNEIPSKLKAESVSQEDAITKKLYKDYSVFKRELFQDLVKQNPDFDQLELFKKSQKLLDRLLFLFFGEDRGLLPPNSVRLILEQWNKLKDLDEYTPLYSRFKKYFGYLNTGFKGKQFDVFAYNGGLFKPDEILDVVKIDDALLYSHTKKLADYDFASEVDVNILGHIFENSLNELDEVKAQLAGEEVDKTKTKRKKDGVFYTPKYITKYIVENTVGKLCDEKKLELGIEEEEYFTDKKRQQKTKLALLQKLEEYRTWLHQLTIIDPACGSGAFLNETLNFLIAEHQYIDELEAKLTGSSFTFTYHSESILEHNLFGVDLNEESVEIAKLSLWLRTAEPNRKLNDLSSNIKCGNSLIDDPEVAGDKAFNWEKEFPQVFAKGGFDVVIGNPPYVFGGNNGINKESKLFFKNNYSTGDGKVNLFTLFIEKSHNILKNKGEFAFIIPNTFLRVTSYYSSRKYFINNFQFRELADLGNDVFAGAVTSAIILIATKQKSDYTKKVRIIKKIGDVIDNLLPLDSVVANNFIISTSADDESQNILNKMKEDSLDLVELSSEMIFGVVISKNISELVFEKFEDGMKPFLEGKDIAPYLIRKSGKYLKYIPEKIHRPRSPQIFEVKEKLLVQRITGGKKPLKVAYDDNQFYNKESINNIILKENCNCDPKYILSLLNSKLINWFYNKTFTNNSTLTVNISKEYLSKIPIKGISIESQIPFIKRVNHMLSSNKELYEVSEKFQRTFQRKFEIETPSKKLQDWYSLSFAEFIKELSKQKIKLNLSEEAEWEDYFLQEQRKALEIQNQIHKTDKEIDQMVYELYGLTEEEIEIVEKN